jgi:hypothetical protein
METDMTADAIVAELHNPAVEVAEENERENDQEWHVFSTGIVGRLKAVSPSLVDTVVSRIKEPKIPVWHDPDKDRDEPNPSNPDYLAALEQFNHDRGIAAMDAMIMFGVELKDGLPEDDEWVDELAILGIPVDKTSKTAKLFAYKRYKATGQPEVDAIMRVFQGGQGVASSMRSFRR